MATQTVKMRGKVYWAKVYAPDVAFGASTYKLDFYPLNDAEFQKFKEAGIQKTVKENENGKYFQLSRPDFKLIKGEIITFTSPVIEDKEGKTIVDHVNVETGNRVYSYNAKDKNKIIRRGNPILIGNGSEVEVRVAVYDTAKGKGHRLESVKILDLIEYRSDNKPPEMSTMFDQVEDDKKEKETPPW